MTDAAADPDEEARHRRIKNAEWWWLLIRMVPVLCAGVSLPSLYVLFSLESGYRVPLYGVPVMLAGLVCLVAGYRRRLRDIRRPGPRTADGAGLVIAGAVLLVAGALGPFYLVG